MDASYYGALLSRHSSLSKIWNEYRAVNWKAPFNNHVVVITFGALDTIDKAMLCETWLTGRLTVRDHYDQVGAQISLPYLCVCTM